MTSHLPEFSNLLSDDDVRLFSAGRHHRLYDKLGAHLGEQNGVYFAVWAPNAERVSVFGDFNAWQSDANPLRLQTSSGIWEGFVPGAGEGSVYKYHIVSQRNGYTVDKADQFGFQHEGACPGQPRWCGVMGMPGGTLIGCRQEALATHSRRQSRSTRHLSGPGLVCRTKEIDPSCIWKWPTGSCPT